MVEKETLVREYVNALRNKNASIFVGSGMSMSIFNRDWKKLICPYARKIGVRLKNDNDFPFIAQSYVNSGNDESKFKLAIGNKFISDGVTEFHRTISRLPIHNYWTTNYDTLIENALNLERKRFDIIYNNNSFGELDDTREHIVYKCHGDCKHPESFVITQKDYERFRLDSFNFTHALYNELATSTVLFLGYSFSDPDIKNIIATLASNNEVKQNHFMLTKRISGKKAREQELWINNLERYGIFTCLIDDYNEIESIIKEIEQRYMAYKVFISGSAVDYSQFLAPKQALDFIYKLGYDLVRFDCSDSNIGHGLTIVNGNGLGVGPLLYEGIAEATATYDLDMADYLLMYPFPKIYYEQFEKEKTIEEKYYAYREKMIAKCGTAFFIFGNKKDKDENIINADGVRKEFEIAVKQRKYVFPIGVTGYMAKELSELVLKDFQKYNGNMPNIERIYREINIPDIEPQKIIDGIIQIIDILSFRPECK